MPDRSYYPEAENDGSSIFIENASDADQFMKDSLVVASYRNAAREANIPVSHTFNGEGQTIAFRNAEERAQVEAQMRENAGSLTHYENFVKGDHHPLYAQAWADVVTAIMEKEGHPVEAAYSENLHQVAVTFPNEEAKKAFQTVEYGSGFIDHAINRFGVLRREAGIEIADPAIQQDQVMA